jgi:Fe-S-cluster containining protein
MDVMKKTCLRCGRCCHTYFAFYVKESDLARWRNEKRKDILEHLESREAVWAGDRFVSGASGFPVPACPFLQREGHRFSCAIYETRPQTCRDYEPGSNELCPRYFQKPGPSFN